MMSRAWVGFAALALVGTAHAVVIDFELGGPEYFLETTALYDQYASQGVTFEGPLFEGGSARNGGAVLNQLSSFGILARSGTDFLAFNNNPAAVMSDGGRPVGPETLTFSSAMQSVSIYAGSGFNATVSLEVFNASGASLGIHSASQGAGDWVQLSVAASGIRSARLSSNADYYVFDDLEFVAAPVPEPATVLLAVGALGAAARRRRSWRA